MGGRFEVLGFLEALPDVVGWVAIVSVLIALLATYSQWRYWKGRERRLQRRLRSRMEVIEALIALGEQAQRSYVNQCDPRVIHASFIERCDASLLEHLGSGYVERVLLRPGLEWERPSETMSDDAQFAHYDTARRLDGLRALLAEIRGDLATLHS